MREGIEDYEMLRALKTKSPADAGALARAAINSFTDYARDPSTCRRLERRLLEELSK